MGGVTHNEKSERHHLPLLQSDFNYVYFLKAIKEFNVKDVSFLKARCSHLSAKTVIVENMLSLLTEERQSPLCKVQESCQHHFRLVKNELY